MTFGSVKFKENIVRLLLLVFKFMPTIVTPLKQELNFCLFLTAYS